MHFSSLLSNLNAHLDIRAHGTACKFWMQRNQFMQESQFHSDFLSHVEVVI